MPTDRMSLSTEAMTSPPGRAVTLRPSAPQVRCRTPPINMRRETLNASNDIPVPQDVFEVRVADLVELVAHLDDGLVRGQHAPEVDRRPAHDDLAGHRVHRLVKLLDLLRAVAHRGQDLPRVRIHPVRLLDRADRVRLRIHNLGGSEALRGDVGRSL